MSTILSTKNIVILIGGVAVLAVGVWLLGWKVEKLGEAPAGLPENIAIPVISEKGESEIMQSLPEGLVLNAKTALIQSYGASYPESNVKQTTVVFESSKSAKENYDFYSKWARDNKWEAVNKSEEGGARFLYLRKENEDMNMVIISGDKGSEATISHAKF